MPDEKIILIVNPGSTSLKFKVYQFPEEKLLAAGKIERIGSDKSEYNIQAAEKVIKGSAKITGCQEGAQFIMDALMGQESVLLSLNDLSAIGFKTVHAGARSFGPGAVILTDEILNEMQRYTVAAPLHNTVYMQAIECFRRAAPGKPLAGLFEPAFHATISEEKYTCGVPLAWRDEYGIRRYGFHGASHRYIAETAPEIIGWNEDKRRNNSLISCHLGGSSSLCAIRNGKSVDTTMEFSPQSGIIQSARCETIDPFILIFAQKKMGMTVDEISERLCRESGLKAISGLSGDFRDLHEWANVGNKRAILALEVYYYQVRKQIAAMTASLKGLNTLIFTGGIGENSPYDRWAICRGLQYLGVQIDEEHNERTIGMEGLISLVASPVEVWVIPTNEELIVAREVYRLISGDSPENESLPAQPEADDVL